MEAPTKVSPALEAAEKFNATLRGLSLFGSKLCALTLCASQNYVKTTLPVENEINALAEELAGDARVKRLVELLEQAGKTSVFQTFVIHPKKGD